jgi:aryl-alcohol dehydrogenase-like predicted oxidoreductase
MVLSAMSFSGAYGEANDEDSLKVLSRAIELGCTFWDTAQIYGRGHNEELLGRFLKENPGAREKLFIGSKCGFSVCLSPTKVPRLWLIRRWTSR